ncbi:hypothetical protein AKJ39_00800 [candidate division MSBL1 archaeon SCGC-AAA259J03]|uniref:NurA domain-containing protein n=4 Tax=candidate division MSBL1 TaxID=215777 RepID=A0A656YZK4_9EURY|nr:hypothetical protein AKJ61_00920 [candidate division MSBL1 archaeon SCGC-AAA259B11]KXA98763.1 hypothetical protein AKJ39_00800 [candidate division MSBL1 archaeon SCGC-AAA259J03]
MIPLGDTISLNNHQHLEHKIGKIAEKIKDQGEKRRLVAEILRRAKKDVHLPADDKDKPMIESSLIYPVRKKPLEDLVIAGVDGGVLSKPLHGLDLILYRAAAAIFHYEDDNLRKAEYYPSETPSPQLINVHEPLDSRELEVLTSLKRQLMELNVAKEAVTRWDVDALILDGSVVPQYTTRISGSKTREAYRKLIESFTKLYRICTEGEILLIGAIEDSRSTRIAKIFQKEIFPRFRENANPGNGDITSFNKNKNILVNSRDTAFLDYFLDPSERSFTFKYSEAPANLLKDLGEWRKKIYSFYIKPVPYDRPTRVEFVKTSRDIQKTIEETATIMNSLSASHDACALPSVLIEADARAALAKEEISILRDSIADRLEPSTMLDLRRERRPF